MTEHIKINDTAPRAEYVGDGATKVFPAPFPFLATADLHVWIGDSQQAETTDFSVTGTGETSGGTVTFGVAPDDGDSVVIYRRADVERLSDFLPGSSLRANTLNDEFDRLTLSLQEVATRLDRALRLADHDHGAVPAALPSASARASRILSFDTDGHPIAGPETSIVTSLQTAVESATGSATAAAASASAAAGDAELVGDVAALVQNIPAASSATGDGATLTFTLTQQPVDAAALVVSLDGVLQHLSAFSVSGTDLTFTSAPPDGVSIEVRDLSSTAIVNAVDVSSLATVTAPIATLADIAADVSATATNADDISTVAADLNGANTIGSAVSSAGIAASSATGAAASETAASTSATEAAASATSAATSATNAATSQAAAETARTAALAAEASAEAAESSAVSSATAAAASASGAVAAVADAVGAAARGAFRGRFGKVPPAVLPFYLADVSGVTLTRATVGTAVSEQGGPEGSAIDTPRIEHDPSTSERLGLLLEPAATNLVKHSADQSNAAWVTNGGYFTRTGGQADPAGGTSATRLRCDIAGTSATQYLRQFSATNTYTNGKFTFWARRVTGTGNVRILGLNGSTGTALNITSSLTSDWQRFSHSGSAGAGFLYFGIGLESLNDEIDVAFFQCEGDISGEVSSFIETTTAAATRSADVATVDLSALAGFRPAGFTLLAEVVLLDTDGALMDIGTGSTSEVALDMQSGDLHVTGADSLDLTAASGLSVGDRLVIALRVQTDSVAVSVNGTTVVADPSHTLNGDADEMRLAATLSGSNPLACIVQQIAFFGPLPDSDLETMSNV